MQGIRPPAFSRGGDQERDHKVNELSIHLSSHLSTHSLVTHSPIQLSTHLSFRLPVSLPVHPPTHSPSIFPPTQSSIHLSVCSSVHPASMAPIHNNPSFFSPIHSSIFPPTYLPMCLLSYPSIYSSIHAASQPCSKNLLPFPGQMCTLWVM